MPVVQVMLFGFAIRTDVEQRAARDRRSGAGPRDARAAQPVRRHGHVSDRDRGRPPRRGARGAVPAWQRAAGGRVRAGFADGLGARPARAAPDHHRRHRAEHRQRGSRAMPWPSSRPTSAICGTGTSAGARVRIVPAVRMRFNPTRESSNLFVPGLMAFVLTIISALMTAISLTREKETGTIEALLVSPLQPVADHRRQGPARISRSASSASCS